MKQLCQKEEEKKTNCIDLTKFRNWHLYGEKKQNYLILSN